MKQTVLKQPPEHVRKQICVRTALCFLAIILTLTLNLILVLTVSDRTKFLFCLLNISADVICGVLIIWFCAARIAPMRVLYRLARRPMTDYSGTVKDLSEKTVRYMDMDCNELTVNDRKLFLPAASIKLQVNEAYRFRLVSNIIMEAEQ